MTLILIRRDRCKDKTVMWQQRHNWSDVATSQGMPGKVGSHQKLGEVRKDPPLESGEGAQPCRHLDLGLLAPEPREDKFLLF